MVEKGLEMGMEDGVDGVGRYRGVVVVARSPSGALTPRLRPRPHPHYHRPGWWSLRGEALRRIGRCSR